MTAEKRSWIILICLSLVWGSSFILMDRAMRPDGTRFVLSPYQVGALRITFAGLVLMPVALRNLKFLKGKDILWLSLVGFCGSFFPAILFTVAETRISTSMAGMLNMGTSFFVVIISVLIYRHHPSKLQLLGMLIGGFGLYQILGNQISFKSDDIGYAGLVLLATLGYGISLTTIKFKLAHLPPLIITALSFFIVTFPALGMSVYLDSFSTLLADDLGGQSLSFLLTLSIIGTALAVFLFNRLVSISSHIFASGVTYLIPVVAIFIGVAVGEEFKVINLIWIVFIISGVYLMNKKKLNS